MDKQWQLKVCDFGLARFNTADSLETMSKMCGTYAYLGPEMFHGGVFSEKTDIWAFGITMLEILTRERPYGDKNPISAATEGFLNKKAIQFSFIQIF